jgi:hypothetical protein
MTREQTSASRSCGTIAPLPHKFINAVQMSSSYFLQYVTLGVACINDERTDMSLHLLWDDCAFAAHIHQRCQNVVFIYVTIHYFRSRMHK